MLEDLRAYGAPETEIERWKDDSESTAAAETVALPHDCREAVAAFIAADTQWRQVKAGDRLVSTGLDYAGAKVAIEWAGITVTPTLFADLQFLEREALVAMSER